MEIRKIIILCKKNANIPKIVADHLFGKDHTASHRMCTGAVIMIVGVVVSKTGSDLGYVVHCICDGAGYLIHGIGGAPFIEWLARQWNGEGSDEV